VLSTFWYPRRRSFMSISFYFQVAGSIAATLSSPSGGRNAFGGTNFKAYFRPKRYWALRDLPIGDSWYPRKSGLHFDVLTKIWIVFRHAGKAWVCLRSQFYPNGRDSMLDDYRYLTSDHSPETDISCPLQRSSTSFSYLTPFTGYSRTGI
jgi:hypothetical protein